MITKHQYTLHERHSITRVGCSSARARAHAAAPAVISKRRHLLRNKQLPPCVQDFPSVTVPIGLFFAHVARPLLPRYYSISSSPKQHPTTVHITAAVVAEATPSGRVHSGVATAMLARLPAGAPLHVFIRKSTFRLPASPGKPVVMVGPGTGLAPFRAFLQERAAAAAAGAPLGPALLFFGCRDPEKDYIYRDELEAAAAAGTLTHLSAAFSRTSAPKTYVQHDLLRHKCDVFAALDGGGTLFVCGDAKHMARDVHRAVLDVAKGCNGGGDAAAEAWVAALQQRGCYLQDVW